MLYVTRRVGFIVFASMLLATTAAVAAPITILHDFTSGAIDGRAPTGLLLDGSVLYGTTEAGGLNNAGTVYRLNTNGTGFSLLHTFTGITGGISPQANLTLDGTTLYGTTAGFGGTVYKLQTNGTGFSTLHRFPYPGTPTTPQAPANGVAISGSTLYGTTVTGGANANSVGNGGTIFSIGTDGTGFSLMHEFDPTTPDGWNLRTALTISGNTIYGMTQGSNPISPNGGTIFKINADGTGFQTIKTFPNTNTIRPEGAIPAYNGLTLVGNRLYGVTTSGGFESGVSINGGVLFAIDTDGSNFDVLHTFGAPGDGRNPRGTLALQGTTLYGTTFTGGAHGMGTIFHIELDGTGYNKFHDFAGGANDGARPWDPGLVVDGNTLYGTTIGGGQFDLGVVYTIAIPEPSTLALLTLTAAALLAKGNRSKTG